MGLVQISQKDIRTQNIAKKDAYRKNPKISPSKLSPPNA